MKFKDYINETFDPLSALGIKSFKDNLDLEKISELGHHWVIEAGIDKAVLGLKGKKLVWYSGEWSFGQWDESKGIWKSGVWKGGTDSKGKLHKENDSPDKW